MGADIKRKSRIYYTLLFSYLLVLIIPLIFGGFIYRRTISVARSETEGAYMNALKQTAGYADNRLLVIRDYAASFLGNPKVQSATYVRSDPTPRQTLNFSNLQQELNLFKYSYDLVERVDIFFPNGGFVLGTQSRVTARDMEAMARDVYRMDYGEWISLSDGTKNGSFHIYGTGSEYRILYILSVDTSSSVYSSGATMLVTISPTSLLALHSEGRTGGDLLTVWENGVVADSSFDPAGDELSRGLPAALERNSGKTLFRDDGLGKNISVLRTPSGVAAVDYVQLVDNSEINRSAAYIVMMIGGYILLCLITGVAVSLYLTKRNYRSINPMLQLLKKIEADDSDGSSFSTLSSSLIAHYRQMEDRLSDQRDELGSVYFTQLLRGFAVPDGLNTVTGIDFDRAGAFVVMIFAVSDYGESFPVDGDNGGGNAALVDFALKNTATELLGGVGESFVGLADEAVVGLLAGGSGEELTGVATSVAEELVTFFREKLGVSVICSISRTAGDTGSIHTSYAEASAALEYGLAMQTGGPLILCDRLEAGSGEYSFYAMFSSALKQGDARELYGVLCYITDFSIKRESASPQYRRLRIGNIVDMAIAAATRLGMATRAGDIAGLTNRLLKAESFEELRKELDAIFLPFEGNDASAAAFPIQEILAYIQEHYLSPDISLTSVAEKFMFNSSYLSRKFKQYIGTGYSEYVQLQRFEHAKELLSATNMPISDIAGQTGYFSTQAFTNAFKKNTGMSPSRYRQTK